jgi:Flp pilus assembly protein CpaB
LAAVLLGVLGLLLLGGSVATSRGSVGAASPAPMVNVVVTVRALQAGATLTDADVSVDRMAVGSSFLNALREAVGRRAAVALPAGVPLVDAMLLDPAAPQPGHRLVRISVDASSLPVAPVVGQLVDVVAAIANDQSGAGHLVIVTTAKVVAVAGGGLTLDVDAVGAARLLWAESFAKSLRVLARPPGDDSTLPALDALT